MVVIDVLSLQNISTNLMQKFSLSFEPFYEMNIVSFVSINEIIQNVIANIGNSFKSIKYFKKSEKWVFVCVTLSVAANVTLLVLTYNNKKQMEYLSEDLKKIQAHARKYIIIDSKKRNERNKKLSRQLNNIKMRTMEMQECLSHCLQMLNEERITEVHRQSTSINEIANKDFTRNNAYKTPSPMHMHLHSHKRMLREDNDSDEEEFLTIETTHLKQINLDVNEVYSANHSYETNNGYEWLLDNPYLTT
jgi:hypothetical protein